MAFVHAHRPEIRDPTYGENMTSDTATVALSPELMNVARLEQDERVEWVGRPQAHATVKWKAYRKAMMYTPVLILIGGYKTVLDMLSAAFNPLKWGVFLLCMVFPGVLIWVIGKCQEILASDMVYAVTNKRALIFTGPKMREFKSVYYLDTIDRFDGFKDLVMDRMMASTQGSSGERLRLGFIGLTEQDAESAQPFLVAALNPPLVRTLTPQQDMQIFETSS